MRKIYNLIIVLIFAVLIAVPLATTSIGGGEISDTEKRVLAEVPETDHLLSKLKNRIFMEETENWFNDHIGQRERFRKIHAKIMNQFFNISTSDTVVKGRHGYYFFNKNNNLEIAKGTYPLTVEDLEEIKRQHTAVVAWYSKDNTRFILQLTPSKVSLYPENLPFEKKEGIDEPSEIIENILVGNGEIVNVKKTLISNKDKGDLFFLTDSHWNVRGSYYAYTELLATLNPSIKPIEANWGTRKRTGDLYQSLGLIGEKDQEIVPDFIYEWNSRQISEEDMDSDFLDTVKLAFEEQETSYTEPEIYINDSIESGTVVIYGDSMMAGYLNYPRYLCEHFHKVVVLRLREITPEVDNILKPDIVIYSSTERLVNEALKKFGKILL